MAKKKNTIPSYLYHENPDLSDGFAMITNDLICCEAFQKLSTPAQLLYIKLCVLKNNITQSQCLYNTLKSYQEINSWEMPDIDIKIMAGQTKKTRTNSRLFVMPSTLLKRECGYPMSTVSRIRTELIEKGWIRKVYEMGLRGVSGEPKILTVYEFCNEWKK